MLKVLLTSLLLSTVAFAKQKITLTEKNTVILDSVFDEMSTANVSFKANELSKSLGKDDPIYLVLNTPGGYIDAGLDMIRNLNSLPQKVNTITIFAASMGFQTVQGLTGKRYIVDNGILMSHRAAGGVQGQFDGELNSRLNLYTGIINNMELISATRMGIKIDLYKSLILNELWVPGFKIKQFNVADEVVDIVCDQTLGGTVENEFQYFGMIITLIKSKCPSINGILGLHVNGLQVLNNDLNNIDMPAPAKRYLNTLLNNKQKFVTDYIITGEFTKFNKGSK